MNLGKKSTKVVVSGPEGEICVSKYLREASSGKFSVVCEMREIDPWKMCESKEGDPEVGERFCVCGRCKTEASWWISG